MSTRRNLFALAGGALLPLAAEIRIARADCPATERWREVAVAPKGPTRLGISFRAPQLEALGLDAAATLRDLLAFPFDLIRLGAYWDRIETRPGRWCFDELDAQVEAAEAAGKEIIVCVGAVKTFGYPEFFVPTHHLLDPLPEGRLVEPATHPALLAAASAHVTRVVERYRGRRAIVAWQVEHEAVDPLGMEHSWRLSERFVAHEVDAVRAADRSRPIVMNGFLPTSLPVRTQQWWRTRDQGDSLAVAQSLADIVGIDFYPRHGLASVGRRTCYLDGSRTPWAQGRRRRLFKGPVMITEGQAEPWETVTTPPNPDRRCMYSCRPEQVIENYNQCQGWGPAWAYLFWGAEYWILRRRSGDPRYLGAFGRILTESAPGDRRRPSLPRRVSRGGPRLSPGRGKG